MKRIIIQLFPLLRNIDPPGIPLKEPDAVIILKLLNGKAYGGLGQRQPVRRPGKAPILIYRYKNPQLQ